MSEGDKKGLDFLIANMYDSLASDIYKKLFRYKKMKHGLTPEDLISLVYLKLRRYEENNSKIECSVEAFSPFFYTTASRIYFTWIKKSKTWLEQNYKYTQCNKTQTVNATELFEYVYDSIARGNDVAIIEACIEHGLSKKLVGTTDYNIIKSLENQVVRYHMESEDSF